MCPFCTAVVCPRGRGNAALDESRAYSDELRFLRGSPQAWSMLLFAKNIRCTNNLAVKSWKIALQVQDAIARDAHYRALERKFGHCFGDHALMLRPNH